MNEVPYDKDLAAWVAQQVEYLRSGQFDKLDLENFIDEFEDVGRSARRSMHSYFVILIAHFLKLKYQPEMASRSWIGSINNAKRELQRLIKESPSLKQEMEEHFKDAWEGALKLAIDDTGMKKSQFPMSCPWSVEKAMAMNVEF